MSTNLAGIICLVGFALSMSTYICAGEELRTLDRWVKVYEAEQKAAYERHPDLPDIERGTSMFLTAIGQNPSVKIGRKDCTPLGQRYYDAYDKFINGPGKAMLEKWKKDGKLSPEDEDYKWVIHATAAEHKKFSVHKDKAIARSIIKAYFQEPLARQEVDAIRLHLACMGKAPGWTCGVYNLRPRNVESWAQAGLIKWEDHFETICGIQHGTVAPDMRFLRYDALASGPIQKLPFEYSLDALVTPRGVASLNDCVNSLKVQTKDGKTILMPDYSDFDRAKPEQVFSLYEELKKGKPVFIFSEATTNTFDYIPDVFSKECLYLLFKDDITFFHHDFRQPGADYGSTKRFFMPEVWDDFVFTRDRGQPVSTYRRINYDTWCAEVRDLGFMRYPVASVPVLMDTRGGANTLGLAMPVKSDYFVDTNRIQCAWVNPRSRGGRYSLMDQNKGPFYTYAGKRKKLIPRTSYVPMYTTHFRQKILFLKIMESLDWKYDADSPLLQTYYKDCLGELLPYQEIGFFVIKGGTVESVDVAKKQMVVKGTVDKLMDAVEEMHVIHLGDRPRVMYIDGNTTKADGKIEDVAVGDKVSVYYQLKTGTKDYKMLRAVSQDPKVNPMYNLFDLFWVTGEIAALDVAKGTCTVKMPKPDVASGEWLGFAYWHEARETETTRKFYTTGKRMLDGGESARTFNLIIDSAVELSVNGLIQFDMSGMKVGDKGSFSFNMSGIRNEHPNYHPWHLMVVTKGKLTGLSLEGR